LSTQPAPHLAGKRLPHDSNVVLVLDSDGRILVASAAAYALWQAGQAELVGDLFPNLFSFDVTSRESSWVQSQWEVLLAAASAHPIVLRLQPKEAAAFDATVRLEKAGDDPGRYFAFVTLPPASVSAPPFPTPIPPDSFLSQLHDRSPLGFFDLNFQKNEVYYSPTWKRMLGYTDVALPNTYEAWMSLIHPEDSSAAPDRQARVGATGQRQFSLEFRMRHAEGHYVWVQSVGVQVFGPNGALQRVMGVHLDIADRKEFEEATLRADERLQLLGDRGRAGLFDLDFAAGLYWLSPGLKSLLGYGDTELPDTIESVLRALPMDETAGGLPAYFLSQHPSQTSYFETLRLRHREDREVQVQAVVVRHISRRKELQRVVGFVLPLPETAAIDTGPGLPAAHLATMMAELAEAVLLTDAAGQIIYLNAKAEHTLGRTHGESIGLAASDVFRLVHRESGQAGESPIARALATGEGTSLNTDFALDTGTGAPRPVAFSTRPVMDATGRAIGAVVVFRLPDEMSLTPEELVRANRFVTLGQLAGGIAHDYNNLLTTILGGISLAKDMHDDSGLRNSEDACEAAKRLSRQLLTFARGGTGVRQVVKPAEILQEAQRLAAAGSTARIETTLAPDVGNVCVDRAQMLQVFQNLIINAIQAMPTGQGQIWISAANVTLAAAQVPPLLAGDYVQIAVQDNGSGIRAEHLAKIFEPFFTTKKTGTGLGLATVRSIVKRHGGQIGVESEVGRGTVFTVFLPLADQPEQVEARRRPALNYATQTGRILFMDDDEQIRILTKSMIESLEYKCDLARDGEEAIQLYKRYLNIGRPYDLVIMDLTIIGGMGGEQTFKVLRDLHPDVCAIIASGYDNDEMCRQFLDLGFFGYLRKPYRVGDLGRMIRKVLGK
jgi:PAS domain S-box-containing protein